VTTPTVTETRRAGQTNERVELGRYTVTAGERVIHGKRVLGVVRFLGASPVVVGVVDPRLRGRHAPFSSHDLEPALLDVAHLGLTSRATPGPDAP